MSMLRLINRELFLFLKVVDWRKWKSNDTHPSNADSIATRSLNVLTNMTFIGRTANHKVLELSNQIRYNYFDLTYTFRTTPENFICMTLDVDFPCSKLLEDGVTYAHSSGVFYTRSYTSAEETPISESSISYEAFCEEIDNLITTPEFNPTLEDQ